MLELKIFRALKKYAVEILIGGGVIVEGYNFVYKPWQVCESSVGGLPKIFPECENIQSPELMFLSIVMVVVGAIIWNIRRKK